MQSKLRRRAWGLALVGAVTLSVAACGGGNDGEQSAAPSADGSGTGVPVTSDPLVFWDLPWGDSTYVEAAEALVARYTQETGQKVEYRQIPWDDWVQVYITAVTTNSGPDVTTGGAFLQHRLATMGEVASLDDLAATYSADDFVPGALDNFKYEGTQVAIPFNADFRAIYYRTDLFEEAGIEVPTTWDEFYEAAKALTHDDQFGYVSATTDSGGQWTALFWSVSNGGAYLDDDMKPAMASEANVEALEFLKRLYDEGLTPPGEPGYVNSDAQRLFYSGKAAMMMDAPGLGAAVPEDQREFISVMPMIESPAGLTQNVGSVNGIMLLEDSDKKEQGKAFIDWWSKNSLSLWVDGNMGPFPARLSLMADPYFTDDPFKSLFTTEAVPTTVMLTYPHAEAHVEMDIMDGEHFYVSVLQQLYTSSDTPMQILEDADARYAKAIEQLNGASS